MESLKIIFTTILVVQFILLSIVYFRKKPVENILTAIQALSLFCAVVSYTENKDLELIAYIAGIVIFVVFLIFYIFFKKIFKTH